MRRKVNSQILGLCALSLLGLSSCVDENYNLSEDVDMNVTVGGDVTLPGSDTEEITLKKIFDLDPDCVVKADPTTGDYKLIQDADPSFSNITVEKVKLDANNIHVDKNVTELQFKPVVTEGAEFIIEQDVDKESTFSLKKEDVTHDLVKLNFADMLMDSKLRISFTGNNGLKKLSIKKGFRVILPSYMELVSNDSRCQIVDNHILEIKNDLTLLQNHTLSFDLRVSRMDFSDVDNQGLIERGMFAIEDKINVKGTAYVTNADLAGGDVNVRFESFMDFDTIELTNVNGVVDPKIDIDVNPVNIDNLPDFLTDEEVRIKLTDPRIFLKVSNESPASVNFMAKLSPMKGGKVIAENTVEIGHLTNKGSQIIIPANVKDYVICVHQTTNNEGLKADAFVSVPNLNKIVETIPEQIQVKDVVAKVLPNDVTVNLGKSYNVGTEYQVDSPLQFNEGTKIIYSDTVDGWNEDAKDLEIRTAVVTLDAENAVPMDMEITIDAIDLDGNVIPNVIAKVEGNVKAGLKDQITISPIKVNLTSKEGSFKHLDGIKYHVSAVTDAKYNGINLNERQMLILNNIKVKVIGGVNVDLN